MASPQRKEAMQLMTALIILLIVMEVKNDHSYNANEPRDLKKKERLRSSVC